jgi:hypothetical protein
MRAVTIGKSTIFSCVIVSFCMLNAGALATETQQKGGSQRQTISGEISPDETWWAFTQEDVCSDGYFITTIIDTVQLVRRDTVDTIDLTKHAVEPRHEDDVLAIDEHGRPENRPLTRWLSPQTLQITVPNKSLFSLRKSTFEGIEILIKYDPDDPVERERWLKSLGLQSK